MHKSLTIYDEDYAFYLNQVKKQLNKNINNPDDKFTIDHIIPLNGRKVCGLNTWNNLQLISRKTNVVKKNYFDAVEEKNYLLNFNYNMLPKIPKYKEIKPKKTPESDASKRYQDFLSMQGISFELEVETECGYADIVTDDTVIEVKEFKSWKHALGQILVYNYLLSKSNKEIYLFGEINHIELHLIHAVCEKYNVIVKTEDDIF